MRKIFLLFGLIFLFFNGFALYALTLSAPVDGSVNVTRKPLLCWQSNKNIAKPTIRFDVYLDEQPIPVKKIASGIRDTSFLASVKLSYKTYYWKVIAMDGSTQVEQSPVYSFTPWQESLQPLIIDLIDLTEGTYAMGNSSFHVVIPGLGTGPIEGTYPQHTVTLGSFSIGKYEVTYQQYAQFLNSIKNNLRVDLISNRVYFLQEGKEILLCDIKSDAQAFNIKKHSQIEWDGTSVHVRPGFEQYPMSWIYYEGARLFSDWAGCRLPTEAEWEYAAKGGSKTNGYEYSGSSSYDQAGWYIWNSKNINNPISGFGAGVPARDGRGTHSVGTKLPNELGIYDMSGNVTEFCSDFFESNQYAHMESLVPLGPVDYVFSSYNPFSAHVMRGGSWDDLAHHSMVIFRQQELSEQYAHKEAAGFRVVGKSLANSRYYVQGVVRDEWGHILPGIEVKSTSGAATTEVTGRYVLRMVSGSTCSITPEKAGYEFSPSVIYINDLDEHRTDLNFVAYLKREHTISGRVTDQSSNPLKGVHIKGLPDKIFTDHNGYYTVQVPDGADYALTPILLGYAFQSIPFAVSDLHADLTADFTAAYVGTVTISGDIKRIYNGTVITLENNVSIIGLPVSVNASSGSYTYQVNKGWSGVLSAVKSNYLILPHSVLVTNIQTDLHQDFNSMATAGADKIISGTAKDSRGNFLEGVEIKGFPVKVLTNSLGEWNIKIADNWTGSITAVFENYSSLPTSILLTGPYDNFGPVPFILNPPGDYLIAGTVLDRLGNPLQGVSITGLNGTGTLKTDINGSYTTWVNTNYSGVISATFSGYAFAPPNIPITSVQADLPKQDFNEQLTATDLNNASGISAVVLYPNPTNDACRVNHNHTQTSCIRVYSIQGELLLSEKLEPGETFGETLTEGMYLVYVDLPGSESVVKLIKK